MVFTFLKSWCNSAELELVPQRSDSYTSQETLIIDEVKAKPRPLAKMKKDL